MLRFVEVLAAAALQPDALRIALAHDQRRRSRLRVELPDGRSAGLFLPRGTVLRDGDLLRSEEGLVARVHAAAELVSVASTSDTHLLARAAYHLGNRHVPLQIELGRVVYPHDHVLDGMCRELGLEVTQELVPFEPEAGGYGGEHRHGGGGLGPWGGHRHG